MNARSTLLSVLIVAGCPAATARGADEVLLRFEVVSPVPQVVEEGDGVARVELWASPGTASLPVEIDVVLESRLDACAGDPAACDGQERAGEKHCYDLADNDGDGKIDREDPDCVGVQGYSILAITDPLFHVRPASTLGKPVVDGTTFVGTVGDDATRPPGIVRAVIFRSIKLFDPTGDAGLVGVFANVLLTTEFFAILPPISVSPVLKIRGDIELTGLNPGETSQPIRIDLHKYGEPRLDHYPGWSTVVTINGNSYPFAVRDLEIVVAISESPLFQRGETNNDGVIDLSDGLFIVNYLFVGGPPPVCLDSSDTDDNGSLEITDAVGVFGFLFLGYNAPPSPGVDACGPDPTADTVPCEGPVRC